MNFDPAQFRVRSGTCRQPSCVAVRFAFSRRCVGWRFPAPVRWRAENQWHLRPSLRSNRRPRPPRRRYRPETQIRPLEDRKLSYVRFGSQADMCGAKRYVRFAPESDCESGLPQKGHVCFGPKADMATYQRYLTVSLNMCLHCGHSKVRLS
jgi:hypothetical protein